jgi:hypothetical protein
MTYAQRIIELAGQLPEPVLAEIVDFAEFVAQRQEKGADSFAAFYGGLKDAPLFEGRDGQEVQQELRNEWA